MNRKVAIEAAKAEVQLTPKKPSRNDHVTSLSPVKGRAGADVGRERRKLLMDEEELIEDQKGENLQGDVSTIEIPVKELKTSISRKIISNRKGKQTDAKAVAEVVNRENVRKSPEQENRSEKVTTSGTSVTRAKKSINKEKKPEKQYDIIDANQLDGYSIGFEERKVIVRRAYRLIAQQRGLAYGTPNSPIYGENTEASMRKAFMAMELHTSPYNVFCDVGSGTGAPSIHAACEFPDLTCYGFELMGSRWWLSQSILRQLLLDPLTRESALRVMLAHLNLDDLGDFGPCTHVFSFDTGFPQSALEAFARALNSSNHVRVLGSFQKIKTLEAAGFKNLKLHTQLSMKMVGSSEGKTIFIYHVLSYEQNSVMKQAPPHSSKRNWDLTRVCPVPSDSVFDPSVPHTESYKNGEAARLSGFDAYKTWLEDQIGLHRISGVRTRSSYSRRGSST